MVRWMAIAMLPLLVGCPDPCDRGPMTDSPLGLVVTEAEHPTGWGRSACFQCHAQGAMHQNACVEGVDYDLLRERVWENGTSDCSHCHGDNGLPAPPETTDDVTERTLLELLQVLGDTSEEVTP